LQLIVERLPQRPGQQGHGVLQGSFQQVMHGS
jgi:hypothetical protein